MRTSIPMTRALYTLLSFISERLPVNIFRRCFATGMLPVLALLPALSSLPSPGQAAQSQEAQPSPATASASSTSGSSAAPYILKVTTREVGVEVIAIDQHQRPVRDLKESEFQVFEIGSHPNETILLHGSESPANLSDFQAIDPSAPSKAPDAARGFQGTSISTCATRATFRYKLSFRPSAAGSSSGYHVIRVTTSRPHVTLYYRRRYFVGATSAPASAPVQTAQEIGQQLQRACASLATPSSIGLTATPGPSALGDSIGYFLDVQADALSFLPLPDGGKQFHLDYGICAYNSAGLLQGFFRTSDQHALTPPQYEQVLTRGIRSHLAIPKHGTTAMLRFVVRDAGNGNIGTIDVPLPVPTFDAASNASHPGEMPAITAQNLAGPTFNQAAAPPPPPTEDLGNYGSLQRQPLGIRHPKMIGVTPPPLPMDIGSFGSPIPLPAAMCGDVYQVPEATTQSVPDFWNLNPLGEVHPYFLNVGEEILTRGIPGIINLGEWIGIDYYGKFWVTKPGKYGFWLYADDGARLSIDDQQVINVDGIHLAISGKKDVVLAAGSHTLHLPYFQGPGALALVLQVRGPGEKHYKVFDVRDFSAPPPAPTAGK